MKNWLPPVLVGIACWLVISMFLNIKTLRQDVSDINEKMDSYTNVVTVNAELSHDLKVQRDAALMRSAYYREILDENNWAYLDPVTFEAKTMKDWRIARGEER